MPERHAATYVGFSEGTVIGVCACGWAECVPRHQYVYEQDGVARVSKLLQEHISEAVSTTGTPAKGGEG